MNDGCVTTGTLSHSVMSDSCDPVYYSPPGSSVHGIPQARILEYVAISFSRGSFQPGIEPRSSVLQADSLPSEPPGKPFLRNLLFHLFTLQHEPRQDMEMSYPFVHENVQSQHGWLGRAKILSEKATIFLHKAAKHLHATNWSWFSKCRDTIWKPRLFCSFNLACLISFTI